MYHKPNIPKMLGEWIETRIDLLRRYRSNFVEKDSSERDRLTSTIEKLDLDSFESSTELEDYAAFLSDEYYILDEIRDISNELLIVALYRLVELETVRQLKRLYSPQKASNLYAIEPFKSAMLKDHKFDVTSISGFKDIDELRCINNSIKHNGKVSGSLAKFPGWVKDSELQELDKAFKRLSKNVPKYLSKLTEVLIEKST